jgi:hypothetical protein
MREPDRFLQAMVDRDTEAELPLGATRIRRHDPARLVVRGSPPRVPRRPHAALDIERQQRVLSDDARSEANHVQPPQEREALTGAEPRVIGALYLKAQVRVLGLDRQPSPPVADGGGPSEREDIDRLVVEEADRGADPCLRPGGFVRCVGILDVEVGRMSFGPCDTTTCE